MGIEEFLLDRAEKKGIKKGIEKGIEEGIEKGRQQERKELMRETALKMIKSGVDMNIVSDVTDLSIAELERLN